MPSRAAAFALVLLVLAMPAFWPDYGSRPGTVDRYTHAHAALGVTWLLALIAQPLLIRARRVRLHKAIGAPAVAVGVAFVVSSVLLTHHRAARMDAALFERAGHGFALPLIMAVIFAAALLLAVQWRRVMPMHARFMICTALALVDPLVARLLHFYGPPLPAGFLYQVPAFAIIVGVMVGMLQTLPPAYPGRRTFRHFTVVVAGLLALHFVAPWSAAWLEVMRWFRALPLT